MRNRIIRLIVSLALLAAAGWLLPQPGRACSAFVLTKGGRVLFGRNFDFFTGLGFVVVNPRHLSKTALVYPGNPPARWVSKYGSVTFNQVGREFPMGGMNEQGLVVECLWLHQTQYSTADARPTLTELQWIQYQLDNCRTVEEILASDSQVRILPSATKLHFLVCDRRGRAGVVEFLEGQSKLYSAGSLPVKALANATYAECLEALKSYRGFGGGQPIPDSPGSPERFARLAAGLNGLGVGGSDFSLDRAFRLLDSVRYDGAESPTQWRIIYDPLRLEIVFMTRNNSARRSLRLGALDFSCGRAGQVLDLDEGAAGDIGGIMKSYSSQWNRERTRQIFDLYRKTNYAPDVPEMAVMLIGNYPETTGCAAALSTDKTITQKR